jgi:hypothetical protein
LSDIAPGKSENSGGDVVLSHHPAGLETGQRRIEANGLVIHGWGYRDEYFDQFLGQFVDLWRQRNHGIGVAWLFGASSACAPELRVAVAARKQDSPARG